MFYTFSSLSCIFNSVLMENRQRNDSNVNEKNEVQA